MDLIFGSNPGLKATALLKEKERVEGVVEKKIKVVKQKALLYEDEDAFEADFRWWKDAPTLEYDDDFKTHELSVESDEWTDEQIANHQNYGHPDGDDSDDPGTKIEEVISSYDYWISVKKEEQTQEETKQFVLFCDLDGVLVDFEAGVQKLFKKKKTSGECCHIGFQFEITQHSRAWHGMAWQSMAWQSMAWHGMAWHGMAEHGIA